MRPVNLLPESDRRRQPAQGGSSYLVLGVLGVLLVMVAAYVLVANQVTTRQNAAAAASAEADRLEVRALEIGAFGDFAQTKEVRATSVRQLADGRFDWERLMRELARVLPAGGWLQSAAASTSGDPGATGSSSEETGGSGPEANLTGCMRKQSDVATLMLRLGRMHRVEDVTLTESTRGETGTVATVDSCGQLYKFDVTVAFAPSVIAEAPDGETRVPASLGGGQ